MTDTANPGDVVTFAIDGTTQAGIVLHGGAAGAIPVAYDLACIAGDRIIHNKEYTTNGVTVVSSETD